MTSLPQYNLAGRLTQVDNAGSVVPEVTLSMAYDFEGNRFMLGDSQGGQVWYVWNNQRLQSMTLFTDYKSAQVGFSYDTVGRLSSLTRTANWFMAGVQLHHFNLVCTRDALYGDNGKPLRRDPTGRAGTEVGNELDIFFNFTLTKHQNILVRYSKVF